MAQPNAAVPGASPVEGGLAARVVGVITSPRETFQSVVSRPRWFGVLALTTLIVALCVTLPLTTAEGRQASFDQQVQARESMAGQPLSDAEYTQLERFMPYMVYVTAGSALVFAPVMAAIIAGLLWAVFNAALGGAASYRQVFAIVAHAGVISTLGAIFTGIINYARGTAVSSTANLRVLLPVADENSFAGRLLGAIDFFLIWWVFVLAIGLAVLYKRRTQPIAIVLLAIYAVIAIGIAAVFGRGGA